ncbi:MAG: CDP-archaeol synthase [Acidimicrobiales bacterium]
MARENRPSGRSPEEADVDDERDDERTEMLVDGLLTDPAAWSGLAARGPRPPAEGVRIIGAEEAAAAIESGHVAPRVPDDVPRYGDVPAVPPEPRSPLRFPGADPATVAKPPAMVPDPPVRPTRSFWESAAGPADEDLGDPDPEEGAFSIPAAGEPSGPPSLPHWTEPPTGENPRFGGEAQASSDQDDLGAWGAMTTGPRWRDQSSDWEDNDFDDRSLDDGSARVGALREDPAEDELFSERAASAPLDADLRPITSRAGAQSPRARPGGGGASRPPADKGGDVGTRVVTGAIAGAVVLVAAVVGPAALIVLLGAVLVVASGELFQALRARGYQPATLLGVVGTGAMVAGAYARGEQAFPLVLSLFVVFALLWYLLGVVRARPTMNVAVSLLAFLYVGFLGSFAAVILRAPGERGVGVLLGAILATVAHDVGSFFVGRWRGRTLLAPSISPRKTVEGLVGGTVATLLASVLVVRLITPWNFGRALWLGVIVAVAAPLGDLCESMIKRDLDVKDMGSTLPGHGGVLDRIDAMLFVVPATFYLVRILNFG